VTFLALIIKNLVRQRIRTGLTVLGISLGITTVVALGVITTSFKNAAGDILRLGGADFMVAQDGAADLSFSTVAAADIDPIRAYPGVARAEGVLFHFTRVGSNPLFIALGREPQDLIDNPPPLNEGTVWDAGTSDQVILGHRAAADLDASVGDTVTIDDHDLEVVGIFETGKRWEDGGAYMPLDVVQEMASKFDVYTAIYVTVEEGADPRAVAEGIGEDFPNLATISDVGEYGKVDQGVEMLDAANLAISILAVGIGAIGVMNTMVMSVFERTREIGILRAVGWSRRRILQMIIAESLVLCVAAAAVGTALGVLATRAVLLVDLINNLMVPHYTMEVFARALVVAVVVALLGAAYPALRAVRLTPMEALRYE
jgi:putative ABC transport system permease protein